MNGRRIGVAVAVTIVAVATVATVSAVSSRPRAASSDAPVAVGTAPVTRGTVAERLRFTGTLGFDGTYPIAHQGPPGIVTATAAAGATVGRGGVLFAVANQAVRLLYGAVPAYRDLAIGVPAGPDVRQVEENLVALGMDPGRQIVVDERFTAATAAAIRRWQKSWGWPAARRTGALPLGSVAFAPGALRVGQVQAAVGATVGPAAPVLTASSTTRVVSADIPAARQSSLHLGDQVQITVNGVAGAAPGRITRIGRAATTADPRQPSQPDQPATVTVTIAVKLPAAAANLDEAPVGVLIISASRTDVLLVPVVALLPRPAGGYQVRLAGGAYVEVEPGLFDEVSGSVEVTGALRAGQLVQVPDA